MSGTAYERQAGAGRGSLVHLTDPRDHRLAEYRDLNDAALRRSFEADEGVFVVEGHLAVRRLLTSPFAVRSLLVADRRLTTVADLVEEVRTSGAPVYVASPEVVTATVGFDLHRGVVAVARRPPDADPIRLIRRAAEGPVPLLAVLEGVNDHENLGALFRNAAAFGVAGVALDPSCADPLYRRSVRVSIGHVLSVPFTRLQPWPAGLAALRANGFVIVALSPNRATHSPENRQHDAAGLGAMPTSRPIALLLGAEGSGLSAAATAEADLVVGIPMAPGVDSLNVATAAAIAFYHARGQCPTSVARVRP